MVKKRNGLAPLATSVALGGDVHAAAARQLGGGRLAQLGDARRRAVVRLPRPQRRDPRLGDVRRRVEVGLADLEVDDVAPRALHRARLGEHGERRLRAQPGHAGGQLARVRLGRTHRRPSCQTSASSAAAISRITNFCTLPVIVMGNRSTSFQ